MLALLSYQLSFYQIGLLYSCRSLTLNLLEIPSGAMADHWGRRYCMIASFAAYILSFVMFAFATHPLLLVPAMVLYGIGDSFRTGTHKAMIFQWLRIQGRESERTRVYGITRSWSQYGSAISALLAAAFVIATGDFRTVFLFSTIPYVLNIINFLGYPRELDDLDNLNEHTTHPPAGATWSHSLGGLWNSVRETLRAAIGQPQLRGLMFESMSWEGVFGAIKDYLQPVLLTLVLATLMQPGTLPEPQELSIVATGAANPYVVLAISSTYTVLFLLSGWASRTSHVLVNRCGSLVGASHFLWRVNASLFLALGFSDLVDWNFGVALTFAALTVLENFWRPILVSRFDECSDAKTGSTLLSIESQAQRFVNLFVAPAVGLAIDQIAQHGWPGHYWPISLAGGLAAIANIHRPKKYDSRQKDQAVSASRP